MVDYAPIFWSFLVCFQYFNLVTSHKCYVCTPNQKNPSDVIELERSLGPDVNLDSIPICSLYNRSRKEDFIRECPPESSGCLTKFSAGNLMRSCAPVGRDECKEDKKSGETFCYCKNDLCNTPDPKLSVPDYSHSRREGVARALQSGSPLNMAISNDDEDLDETGSGDLNYYDAAYFDEDDEEYSQPEGAEGVTDPPPFIVEEDIKNWNTKHQKEDGNSVDKNGDIEFEDSDDKQSKSNVHSPIDRKTVINGSTRVSGSMSVLCQTVAVLLLIKKLSLS